MIKAIIFDCFGVLATQSIRKDFIDSLPDDIDKQSVFTLYQQYDAGHITRDDFLYRLKDITGQEPQLIEQIESEDAGKNHMLLKYIRSLTDSYKIGLLSNIATDWVTRSFLTKDEQSLFDDMVFSYEVGMTKPDPEMFRLACRRLSVKPSEAILVDDVELYVVEARRVGMYGVVYTNFKEARRAIDELLTQE